MCYNGVISTLDIEYFKLFWGSLVALFSTMGLSDKFKLSPYSSFFIALLLVFYNLFMVPFQRKKYLPLKKTAKLFGYSSDYIGYLIRGGRVRGKKVHKNLSWQVEKHSLIKYCEAQKREIKPLFPKKDLLSLNKAARISDYNPDYIGYLIREGKIEGKKVALQSSWLVNTRDLKRYKILKQKEIKGRKEIGQFPAFDIPLRVRQHSGLFVRVSLASLIIFLLISELAPTQFLQSTIGAVFIEETKIVNLYPTISYGEWQNPQNVQGAPEVQPKGSIDSFSEANSTIYKSGSLDLVFEKFGDSIPDESLPNHTFQLAEIKISFAIEEKEPDIFLIENQNTNSETEGNNTTLEGSTLFWDNIKQFLAKAKSLFRKLVQKTLRLVLNVKHLIFSIAKAAENGLNATDSIIFESGSTSTIEEPSGNYFDTSFQIEFPTTTETTTTEATTTAEIVGATSTEATTTEIAPAEATTTPETATTSQATTTQEIIEATTTEAILPSVDTKIIIWWSLDGETWQVLEEISEYPLSNKLNGGYFSYDAPFLQNWDDVKNLKIKFEGVVGGTTEVIAHLDSVWVEVTYKEQVTEEQQPSIQPPVQPSAQPPEQPQEQPTEEPTEPEAQPEEELEKPIEEEAEEKPEERKEPKTEVEPRKEEEPEREEIREIELLSERDDFRSDEEPEFLFKYRKIKGTISTFSSWQNINVKAELKGLEDSIPEIESQIALQNNGEVSVKLKKLRGFRPGLYKLILRIEDRGRIQELEQDFSWGVLAINVNKSIYLPSEKAYLQMAVLDNYGHTVCDADLTLEVIAPDGTKTILATSEKLQATSSAEQEATTTEATTTEVSLPEATTTESVTTEATSTEATSTLPEATSTAPSTSTDIGTSGQTEPIQFEPVQSEATSILEESEASPMSFWERIKSFFGILVKRVGEKLAYLKLALQEFTASVVKAEEATSTFTPTPTESITPAPETEDTGTGQATTTEITITEATTTQGTTTEVTEENGLPTEQATPTFPTQETTSTEATTTDFEATSTETITRPISTTIATSTPTSTSIEGKPTELGEIYRSKECGPQSVTYTPDYFAYYQVDEPGVYQLKLTARTQEGTHTITDSFEVREWVPFDIERIGPTRIWPIALYEMNFNIKANQDFEGEVVETTPLEFRIENIGYRLNDELLNSDSYITNSSNTQEIHWRVDFKKDDSIELRYQFDAPNISPYLYLLGSLKFGDKPSETGSLSASVFEEIRQWQIAADAPDIEPLHADGAGASNQWIDVTQANLASNDGDGSYAEATAADQRMYATVANSSNAEGGINSVTVKGYFLTNDTKGQLTLGMYDGATLAEDTTIYTVDTAAYTLYSWTRDTDPSGGSWSWEDVNNLEITALFTIGPGGKADYLRCTEFWIEVDYEPPVFILNQRSVVWQNDDGDSDGNPLTGGYVNQNTTSTATDTALTMEKGERATWRVQIDNTGTGATTTSYKMQWATTTGQCTSTLTWSDVGTSTEIAWSYGLSGNNGETITGTTTDTSSSCGDGSCTGFATGTWHEAVATTSSHILTNDYNTEFGFMIKTSNAATGTTYCLRLNNNGQALDNYYSFGELSIVSSATKKYSKNAVASVSDSDTTADLTYFLDNKGYSDVASDDNTTRDPITSSSSIPVFLFARKHTNSTDVIFIEWNGSTTVACGTNAVYLQVYNSTSSQWETFASNTTCSANTDFSATTTISTSLGNYYDSNKWNYIRVYQAAGSQTLTTDLISISEGLNQTHYRWRNDDGGEFDKISYGSEYVYNQAEISYNAVSFLDSTHFAVVYRDNGNSGYGTAIIGEFSGTSTISYGSEYVFNAGSTSEIGISFLDSTHFAVAYRDFDNSMYGTAVICEFSSTSTISCGSEYVFNQDNTFANSVSSLDSTHFVVSYYDVGNGDFGTAVIGEISGTSTIAYGSEYVFNQGDTGYTAVSSLDSTHFVVAYRDNDASLSGRANIGEVSGTSTISYGSEYVFNAGYSWFTSVSPLDSTHFVVSYGDSGDDDGKAAIGEFSGTSTISFGSEYLFNSALTYETSVSSLDSTYFVVSYRDVGNSDFGTAVIGKLSGTSTISFSSEYVFNPASTTLYSNGSSISSLDSTHFVVSYEDVGSSQYGTAIIGEVSGASWMAAEDTATSTDKNVNIRLRFLIKNAGPSPANSYNYRLQIAQKTATTCEWQTTGWSDVPTTTDTAVMATSTYVSDGDNTGNLANGLTNPTPTSTWTWTTGKYVAYPSNQTATTTLNQNYFTELEYVFKFTSSATSGYYCLRVTNGDSELNSYSQVAEILAGSIVDQTHYRWRNDDGGELDEIDFGSENVFNSASTYDISVSSLDSTHFVVGYRDYPSLQSGTAIIGEISGTSTISYGSEYVFNATSSQHIAVSSIDSTHFVVAYQDVGNSSYGTAIIGEISGTSTISYGSEYVFNASSTSYTSVASLDSTHFVISYRDFGNSQYGTAIIGEISGTSTISFGSEYIFNTATTIYTALSSLDSTHFVVGYRDYGNSSYGTAIIGEISGTSTISYGPEYVFNTASSSYISVSSLDSTHFVVSYQDDTGFQLYGRARIGEVSGTSTISYGSEYVFNSATTEFTSVSSLNSTHFVVGYRDEGASDSGRAKIGEVSGTSTISYGSEYVFNALSTTDIYVSSLDLTQFAVGYRDWTSGYGEARIGEVYGASWMAAEDTATSTDLNTNIRLRFSIENTGVAAENYNYRLQLAQKTATTCEEQTTGWSDVPTTTDTAIMATSSYVSDGDSTTNLLSATTSNWTSGKIVAYPSNQTATTTLNKDYFTEHEYVLKFTSGGGNTYCSNPILTEPIISLAKNNAFYASTTASSTDGSYSFSNIFASSSDTLTVYIDNNSATGTTVTVTNGYTDISDLDIYQNHIIVRDDNTGSGLTIADMALYDVAADPDIRFDAATNTPDTLTVYSPNELYIWPTSAGVFTPNGNVSAYDIDIRGTFNASGTEAHTVSGSWFASSTTGFNAASSTVIFNATSSGKTITTDGDSFYNLTLNGSGGEWTFQDAATTSNDLTITDGTASSSYDMYVLGGDVTGNGNLNWTANTFFVYGTGYFGGTSTWAFYHLTFGDASTPGTTTATSTVSATTTVLGNLTVEPLHTLNGAKNFTVNGNAPGDGIINLTDGTFTMVGEGSFGPSGGAWTLYNLTFGDGTAGTTTTSGGVSDITVSNVLTISSNQSLEAGDYAWILSNSGTPFVINGNFDAETSIFKYTGTGDTNITATTYNNLELTPSSGDAFGENWATSTDAAQWAARRMHTSVTYDNKIWVIGGYTTTQVNDVWYSTDGATWTTTTDAAPWDTRDMQTSVVYDNKMWVIGGWNGSTHYNDVWYSTDGATWATTTDSAQWSARRRHTSVTYDNKMWVIGGWNGSTYYNDVWYSTDGTTWATSTDAAQWSDRYGHTSVVYDSKMWVIGGNAGANQNDAWYSTDGQTWTQATAGAQWVARASHTSVTYDNKMWVIGGYTTDFVNDVWYSTDGVTWATTTDSAPWSARRMHTSVVYDNKMWVIGGIFTGGRVNDVWYSGPPTYYLESGTLTCDADLTIGDGTYGVAVNGDTNDPTVDIDGDFTIATSSFYTASASTSISFSVGGDWSNTGTFNHSNNTVTFDCINPGTTIETGGTSAGKTFYNTEVNCPGALTIQNYNLLAENNFLLTGSGGFTLEAGRIIEVRGNFTNSVDGAVTTWTDSTLYLNKTGGGYYTINTKTTGSDTYGTLQVGQNTDIRTWDSQAGTTTVDSTGSLYSMDHAGSSGELYVWGDYHTGTATPTDYCSYNTDFDGTDISGAPRQCQATINPGDSWTVDSGATLNVIGGGSTSADISIMDVGGVGESWTQATDTAQWGNRDDHTSVIYDNKIWVMGGDTGSLRNDVWYSTDGVNWATATDNAQWQNRGRHASVVYDNKMWVMGGFKAVGERHHDVWYSTDGATWTTTTDAAPWSARQWLRAVVYDNKMWVIGGTDNSSVRLNDVWYSTDGVNWATATDNAQWSGRPAHTSVVYDGKIWVMGGNNGPGTVANDVWYSTDGATWTTTTDAAPWSARYQHTSVVYSGKMWVMGGWNLSTYYNDVWYSTDGATWTRATAGAQWVKRDGHASVVYDNKMWVIGGYYTTGGRRSDVWYSSGEWNFACLSTCNIQESTWNCPNFNNGTTTVLNTTLNDERVTATGTLNVDWYLGIHAVVADSTSTDIGNATCTISSTSTAEATIWKMTSGSWGTPATSQWTVTQSNSNATGTNPQPNSDGAIRFREYQKTSATTTFYKYNLEIDPTAGYASYNYYTKTGNYLSSFLNSESDSDQALSENWQRDDISSLNGTKDYDGLNQPPQNGTWYVGMAPFFQLSGIVYSDEGSNPILTEPIISLAINNAFYASTTASSTDGSYSFPNVSCSSGDTLAVYIDDNAATGTTVTVSDGSTDITDLDIYQDRIIVRDDNTGSGLTIADMVDWDKDQDPDIKFTATTTGTDTLTVDSPYELYIWQTSAGVFAPNGNVNIYDLDIRGTFTASGTETHTISGSWFASSTTGFNAASSTAVFNATATGKTITTDGDSFYNLTFNGSGGEWTFASGDHDVDNDFTITVGSVTSTSGTLYIGGSWSNSGTFNHGSGTVTFDGSATSTLSGATTFYNLTSTSSSKTLEFSTGTSATTTFEGTLTLNGQGCETKIKLRSTQSGSYWYINAMATINLTYIDVQDSNATGSASIINASSSQDSGNNINWSITDDDCGPLVDQTHYRWRNDDGIEFGWLSGFQYRKAHVISTSTSAGTDYQIRLTVHYATNTDSGEDVYLNGHSRTDFGDVRFTDDDGTTELDYWMEEYATSATSTFWVEVTDDLSSLDQTIYIYYGSSTASTTSNGTSTFVLFDDFIGATIDTEKWLEFEDNPDNAYVYQDNNLFLLTTTGAAGVFYEAGVKSQSTWGPGKSIRYRHRYTHPDTDGNVIWYYGFSDTYSQLTSAIQNCVMRFGSYYDPGGYKSQVSALTKRDGTGASYSDLRSTSSFMVFETKWASSRVEFYESDVLEWSTTNTTYIPATNTIFALLQIGKGAGTDDRTDEVDWIFVRNYVYPEPSHGDWGNEEENPGVGTATWMAAEDAAASTTKDTNIRLRFSIKNTYTPAENYQYRLQVAQKTATTCEEQTTGWADVPTTTDSVAAVMATSTYFSDGTTTTNVANGLTDPSGFSWTTGKMVEYPSYQTATTTLNQNYFTELEYVFKFTSSATNGYYCLRTTNAGTVLDSYTKVAEIWVGSLVDQTHYRWRNDDGGERDMADGSDWATTTDGAPWVVRFDPTLVVYDNKMWLMGGCGFATYYNDVWYSTDGVNWATATDAAPWTAREEFAGVVYDNKMWVIGGDFSRYNDVWYSTDGATWATATDAAQWTGRDGLAAVVYDDKMWVIGGYDTNQINDVWYSTDGVNWATATDAAPWEGRRNHSVVVYDNKMWVIGGNADVTPYVNDVWYSTDGATWATATDAAQWDARHDHTSVVYDNKMWVMGGASSTQYFNDVWYSVINTTGASWMAPEDTATSTSINTNIRLRFSLKNTGYPAQNYNYRLQVAQKTAGTCEDQTTGWSDVPTTTDTAIMATSTYVSDGDSTTNQLSTTSDNWIAGKIVAYPSNQTATTTLNKDYFTEHEYVLKFTSGGGNTYCLPSV